MTILIILAQINNNYNNNNNYTNKNWKKKMQIVQSQASQFLNISYRNGLYQGPFNRFHQQRCGYGLIFTTDNHLVMGTTWK